ncbi:MAG TPA: hypothetical protein VK165_04620 [Azonexus sp.]|nr:hypothetical protein [Azonexus sp.]
MSTCSGKHFCLQAPEAAQIDIKDIAHGLAYQGCYNGQTSHFYSLAQHSLLVASLVPPQHRLAALLHDAAAAYFGSMVWPLRQLLPDFPALEKKIMAAVGEKFGVTDFHASAIRRAHLIILATEQRDVYPGTGVSILAGASAPIPRRIDFMSPEEAKYQFLERFFELTRQPATKKHASVGARRLGTALGIHP